MCKEKDVIKVNIGTQILKCRDDKAPVIFSAVKDTSDGSEPFKLTDEQECSWLKKDESLGPAKLRSRIEPWLTALFQSEHLSLLVGSGLQRALHIMATDKDIAAMDLVKFNDYDTC